MANLSKRSNLQTRIITAVVLAIIVLGTLAIGSTGAWAVLVLFFCACAGWEWLRVGKVTRPVSRIVSVLGLVLLIASTASVLLFGHNESRALLLMHLAVACVFWLVVAPFQLGRRAIDVSSLAGSLTLPVVIGAAWLSAVALQRQSVQLLLAVVVLTVVADVAGYFVGRTFGKTKLAPNISPGKTRAGAVGGVAAAAIWSVVAALYLSIIDTSAPQIVVTSIAGAVLGMFAVMGDLWESQLKRQAGVKDSSNLLPGHGGVLDRIDAQLSVLPLATMLLHLVKPLW